MDNLPSILTPDLGLLLWMLAAFLVVFFVLAKYGFPVITNMVDKRKKYIDESLRNAREAAERLANIQQESEALVAQARQEQATIVKQATEMRDAILDDARSKARAEADRLVAEAMVQINNEKAASLREIRAHVAQLSVDIAERIVRQNLHDDQAQMQLIARILDEIKE